MRILVLGYYYESNLGDDMFMETMPLLFPGQELIFKSLQKPVVAEVNDYDAIICGGGDLVNNYFYERICKQIKNFQGPVYAISLGIPYAGLINKGFLDCYDHVFVRSKTDLRQIQQRLGSTYAHYLPDIGFLKGNIIKDNPKTKRLQLKKKKPNLGIFAIQSLAKYTQILDQLKMFFKEISSKYTLTFYRFDSSGQKSNDDSYINELLASSLIKDGKDVKGGKGVKDIKIDNRIYDTDEMITIMNKLDFAICMRFHSHIFATVANCPFISIAITRKVELYVNEEGLSDYMYSVIKDDSGKAKSIDVKELTKVFNKAVMEKDIIRAKCDIIVKRNLLYLKTKQPLQLLLNRDQRNKQLNFPENISVDTIYQNISTKMLAYGCDPESNKNPENNKQLTLYEANILASELCMDVTGLPSSKYVWGTCDNLLKRPQKVSAMIEWIKQDFIKEYSLSGPRINLNYVNQNSFKGVHRSGWQFVLDMLSGESVPNGVICDTYIDRTFHWAKDLLVSKGKIPYTSPWIGFLHHTNNQEYGKHNAAKLVERREFKQSLPCCRGLITLSSSLSEWLKTEIPDNIPILTLKHPTIFPKIKFNWTLFTNNKHKRVVNIGAWYRNPFTIYHINWPIWLAPSVLEGKEMSNYFPPKNPVITKQAIDKGNTNNIWLDYCYKYIRENNYLLNEFGLKFVPNAFTFKLYSNDPTNEYTNRLQMYIQDAISNVHKISHLNEDGFDKLLCENLIFVNLIDCSAVNTLIECIVRSTPILINKLPAVVEYLGPNYPLYYEDPENIPLMLTELKIKQAHIYLVNLDKEGLRIENFIASFKNSHLYASLNNS